MRRTASGTTATFAVIMAFPMPALAQNLGPVTFRDSLVMRQVAYRAPCPVPVPRVWSLVDSTLGRGPRCSLVELAARSIAQYQQIRPPQTGPSDPWNPLCVRVVVGRNTGSTGLPGDWLVIFDLGIDRTAHVVIDRQTGEVGALMIGSGPSGDFPACGGTIDTGTAGTRIPRVAAMNAGEHALKGLALPDVQPGHWSGRPFRACSISVDL